MMSCAVLAHLEHPRPGAHEPSSPAGADGVHKGSQVGSSFSGETTHMVPSIQAFGSRSHFIPSKAVPPLSTQ